MISEEKRLAFLENLRIKTSVPLCCCMHPDCSDVPIYSHVYQREGVLREISTEGTVMMFTYETLFSLLRNESPIGYKRTGLRKAFAFYGFCESHDHSIFAPIEPADRNVDWYSQYNLYLLGYRNICREYYIQLQTKQILQEYMNSHVISGEQRIMAGYKITCCNRGIESIKKYKTLFENSINSKDFTKYYFRVLMLPFRLDLCLASPITISEECRLYLGPDKDRITDTINIIDIFPHKDRTAVIIGFLEGAENNWAKEIYQMLSNGDPEELCLAMQDILFRSEFHCMSELLYEQIKNDVPLFLEEWKMLNSNYSHQLQYTSNIFKRIIMKELGYTN